ERGGLLGVAGGGDEDRLDAEAADDAVRIAGIEREEEVARLEAHAAHHVAVAEALRGGPAHVEPGEELRRDRGGLPLDEAEAAPTEPAAGPDEGRERATRRRGGGGPDRGECAADDLGPLVEVAAAEELLGGAPLQGERFVGVGALDGGEEARRRFAALAGAGEGVAEERVQPVVLARRRERERLAKERRRLVE